MFYYLKLMFKFWWIWFVLAAITAGAAFYLTFYYFPQQYSASTTLYIMKKAAVSSSQDRTVEKDTLYQDLLASEMLVKDFKEIAKSGIILQRVRDELMNQFPELQQLTLSQMSQNVNVKVKTGTRLVVVEVTGQNPEAAAGVANAIAKIFKAKSIELLNTDNVTIIDEALVPVTPVSPKPVRDITLGGAAGFGGGIMIILMIGYVRKQRAYERAAAARAAEPIAPAPTVQISKENENKESNSAAPAASAVT